MIKIFLKKVCTNYCFKIIKKNLLPHVKRKAMKIKPANRQKERKNKIYAWQKKKTSHGRQKEKKSNGMHFFCLVGKKKNFLGINITIKKLFKGFNDLWVFFVVQKCWNRTKKKMMILFLQTHIDSFLLITKINKYFSLL